MQAYQVLVEQLEMYLKDLRNPESINPIDDAQRVLSNHRSTQEYERKKIEVQIAVQSCHLNDSKARYQNLTDDLQRSKIITKSMQGVTRAVIAKTQALIQDNELKLVNEKKKVEDLEAATS